MTRRTLVTGFLPFAGFRVNPSALLAQSCGRPFELIEVSFDAVDEWLDRIDATGASFERLVMLGLRGDGTSFYLERVARNEIGTTPDMRGIVRGPAAIEPGGPATVNSTLFNGPVTAITSLASSDDAGCYLCNYIYYRALRHFPGRRVGFVHVPPLETFPLDTQQHHLARLLELLESD
jgi:pyrrolidone-carboxylate peptidase